MWFLAVEAGVRKIGSVQFSHPVVCDSLWPHESQHTRPHCPSSTPRVHSDSRPSSQWSHQAISSSAILFSSCPHFFPASGSFPMIRWSKYWSFIFSISSSNKYSGLISFLNLFVDYSNISNFFFLFFFLFGCGWIFKIQRQLTGKQESLQTRPNAGWLTQFDLVMTWSTVLLVFQVDIH